MPQLRTVTIASAGDTSTSAEIGAKNIEFELSSILMEAVTFTGTKLTFQADYTGTWHDVYDTFGQLYSIPVASGSAMKVSLPADVFKDISKVRVVSDASEASERTIKFVFADVLEG
jgi:hypothetical protein